MSKKYDSEKNAPERYQRREHIDRLSGSLVNIILGALILWVGQTTFRHAGQLASVDARFQGVNLQFEAVDGRHETLRERVVQVNSDNSERTRSRFTREDGEKMATRIKELQETQAMLERQLAQQVTNMQIKITALETHGNSFQELALLRSQVQRLQTQNASRPSYRSVETASAPPTYLPPVTRHQ